MNGRNLDTVAAISGETEKKPARTLVDYVRVPANDKKPSHSDYKSGSLPLD
jgi:hypothetical protein